ncbi:MAG: hypothetical protein KDK70_37190 [Myxococcales bacterium]|nr:hypothetical protein [Myxococcales bacterium]
MTRFISALPLVLALACNAGSDKGTDKGTDKDDTDTTDTEDTSDFDGKTAATGADLTCFTPAADTTEWAPVGTVTVTSATVTLDGTIQDFEEEEPVSSRTVQLWFSDVAQGPSDTTGNGDANGKITIDDVPACAPLSWLAKEIAGLEEAKDTYKAHQVFGTGTAGTLKAEFNSVSNNTYRLIPTIVGISIDDTKSVIAGTVYGCGREADALPSDETGRVEGARVRVFSCPSADPAPEDCTTPVTNVEIKYFIENFPDRNQPYTSDDGLFGVFNVPPGTFRVEAYDSLDGTERILGGTIVTSYADSINIANIWAGYPDGVKYPASCFE